MSRLLLYRLLVHYSVPHVDNQKYILRIRQRYFKSNFSLVFTGSVFQGFLFGARRKNVDSFCRKGRNIEKYTYIVHNCSYRSKLSSQSLSSSSSAAASLSQSQPPTSSLSSLSSTLSNQEYTYVLVVIENHHHHHRCRHYQHSRHHQPRLHHHHSRHHQPRLHHPNHHHHRRRCRFIMTVTLSICVDNISFSVQQFFSDSCLCVFV